MITLSTATRHMIFLLSQAGIRPEGEVLMASMPLPSSAVQFHVDSVLREGELEHAFVDRFTESRLAPQALKLAGCLPKISNCYRLTDPASSVLQWACHCFDGIALRGLIAEVDLPSPATGLAMKQQMLRFDIAFRPAA